MSDYDLETADAMLRAERFLYVGFMAHQAIEKILKAYFVHTIGETAPFSHSLSLLAKKSMLSQELSEEQFECIDLLEPLNIEARYPTYKEELLKSMSFERCCEILAKTKDLQSWIKTKLFA